MSLLLGRQLECAIFIGVDLHSQIKPAFISTAANLTNADTAGLAPSVNVPLSAELTLDVNVSDIIISPM